MFFFFFFQAEDGIRDVAVTGVQTCALPISLTSPIVPAPTSRGSSRETRWGSSSRAAIDREGEFERFGDEGTAVRQENVSELQGDQEVRSGPCDLLQEPKAQAEAGLEG